MSRLDAIYRAEQLPVFQNRMFRTAGEARASVRGDVVLVQDPATGLISNQAFDPSVMDYDPDYQNEQGHSAVFIEHLRAVSAVVSRHLRGESLIEVGCGKALFLEHLQREGFTITGLDPTYEGTNPAVIREYFTPETGLRAGGLILRHVLEHVQDPIRFLAQLREANGGSGSIYIEVPCLDWIAEKRAWFDIFYEHVNYFRLDDFRRLFGTVREAGRFFGGQYLYVVADLATLRAPDTASADRFSLPADFGDRLVQCAARMRRSRGDGERARSVVWGGASKGVIFSLFMERAGAPVDMIVDINPAKQGRFVAGTGLRVHAPQEALNLLDPGADVFVMNSNYLDEIRAISHNRFNYITLEHEHV
jgi:methyltransferase family protein/C-methyltransferase-like protein